jgi:predicted transcriptional regulator YdeE
MRVVKMKQTKIELPEIKLVGLKVRTNNKNEIEPLEGKIFPYVHKYFNQNIAAKIPNRKKPGTTFCAYTEYESDHTGDYTYFIGEEVTSFDEIPAGLEKFTIQPQHYSKFTTESGAMPDVVRNAWKKIWQLTDKELGGQRRYHADFEIYDERAADPTHQHVVLDIYIGIVK